MSRISQETFDQAVRENRDDLGLPLDEAIEEAIKQFEAQSVDLSRIVKHSMKNPADAETLINAVKQLSELNKGKKQAPKDYTDLLLVIKEECDKDLAYRVLAGKEGAYDEIITTINLFESDKDLQKECLGTLISLMTKQPDLLNAQGVNLIVSSISDNNDPELTALYLKWTKECCILQETNRQNLYNAGIHKLLKALLDGEDTQLLGDVLAVIRALILDDDIRVEFGRAHEHARGIASETLCSLTSLLKKFKEDELLIKDVILTLSALLVRSDFCQQVENAGGLELIRDIMEHFVENEKINRQCFKLIKALAGNDECKAHLIQKGIGPLIASSLDKHKKSAQTSASGLGCVAALTLRSPENSQALYDTNIAEIIVTIMKLHPKEKAVQKSGCWAIRNMVSRSKYQTKTFLELGVESVLKHNLNTFKDCEYDVKAALRDLGCQVELKEEWTGKGGLLNTSEKMKN